MSKLATALREQGKKLEGVGQIQNAGFMAMAADHLESYANAQIELLDTIRDVYLAIQFHEKNENPNETYVAWGKYLEQTKNILEKYGRAT